jgi:hypothetical protein
VSVPASTSPIFLLPLVLDAAAERPPDLPGVVFSAVAVLPAFPLLAFIVGTSGASDSQLYAVLAEVPDAPDGGCSG